MPSSLLYLVLMLVVIIIWFVTLKRPVYEAVFISFLLLLISKMRKKSAKHPLHRSARPVKTENIRMVLMRMFPLSQQPIFHQMLPALR